MSNVTVYSKPNCVQCGAVYRFLNKYGVPYEVVDLSEDANADKLAEFMAKGITQVPIIVADDIDLFTGFHPGYLGEIKAKYGVVEQ